MQSRVKTRGKWETIEHSPKKSTGGNVEPNDDKSSDKKPKQPEKPTEVKTNDKKDEQK